MKTVGILGGGQLGSMLAESILKLGGRVAVYDPAEGSPAFLRTPFQFVGNFDNKELLSEFFQFCDIVTYEFENVETTLLGALSAETNTPLWPSEQVLKTTQNRILEKSFLQTHNLPLAGFTAVETVLAFEERIEKGPYPTIVKTALGGYDGKGQAHLKNQDEGRAFLAHLTSKSAHAAKSNDAEITAKTSTGLNAFLPCVFEEVVNLWKEVSVIVARDATGHSTVFPVFENEHAHHILDFTLLPASLPEDTQQAVCEIARVAAEKLQITGLLTIEFFMSREAAPRSLAAHASNLFFYINEFAPRPHNSGHLTRNACHMSQFDAHARVLLGIPLSQPQLVNAQQSFCMGNLLGDVWIAQGSPEELDLHVWDEHPKVIDVVLYGKEQARSNRKMGHFVTAASTPQEARAAAVAFRKALEEAHHS